MEKSLQYKVTKLACSREDDYTFRFFSFFLCSLYFLVNFPNLTEGIKIWAGCCGWSKECYRPRDTKTGVVFAY